LPRAEFVGANNTVALTSGPPEAAGY
jgi:hypothetical protein